MSKGDGRQQDVCIQDTSRSNLLSFPRYHSNRLKGMNDHSVSKPSNFKPNIT